MKTKYLLLGVFAVLAIAGWGFLLSLITSTSVAAPPQQGGTTYHTVQRGDHLGAIAARYGTSIIAIVQRNSIANPNRIYIGQRLAIPVWSLPSSSAISAGSSSPSALCTYRIAWGDTLSKIAAAHGTTVQFLMSANALSTGYIYAGTQIKVPCGVTLAASSAPPPATRAETVAPQVTYRVRPGDTLSSIALLYRTTVQAIMEANSIANPHHIYAGQTLRIPLR